MKIYELAARYDSRKSFYGKAHVIERDDGWQAFRIQGVLEFSLIGILSKITGILAENKIGIFAISTYNTDYVLTKKENYQKALDALKDAGYTIIEQCTVKQEAMKGCGKMVAFLKLRNR